MALVCAHCIESVDRLHYGANLKSLFDGNCLILYTLLKRVPAKENIFLWMLRPFPS